MSGQEVGFARTPSEGALAFPHALFRPSNRCLRPPARSVRITDHRLRVGRSITAGTVPLATDLLLRTFLGNDLRSLAPNFLLGSRTKADRGVGFVNLKKSAGPHAGRCFIISALPTTSRHIHRVTPRNIHLGVELLSRHFSRS